MSEDASQNKIKFIEIKLNRDLCKSTDFPTQEYYYEDLLASQIDNPEELETQSTKRKLKEISVSKKLHKEFSKMLVEKGISEREALIEMENFSHLGDGYDKSDPFIDDGEIFDECIPTNLRTEIGGFFINEGPLVISSTDMGNGSKPKAKKKRENPPETSPKIPKPRAKKLDRDLTLPQFLNGYIEKWYNLIGYTANLTCGTTWDGETDALEAIFPLIPPSMERAVNKMIEIYFPHKEISILDEFVAESPQTRVPLTALCPQNSSNQPPLNSDDSKSAPLESSVVFISHDEPPHLEKPIISVLNRFLERMDKKRAQSRLDGPRRPDYEDSKLLLVLYANCRRYGLGTEQWESILEIVATGLNMGGDREEKLSKLSDYLDDVSKHFCGGIDNVLILKFVGDETLKIEIKRTEVECDDQSGKKKGAAKVIIPERQKNVIKTVFVLFFLAIKIDKLSGATFLMHTNTFIKHFVSKLGGSKAGLNQSLLLSASEFPLRKIKKLFGTPKPAKIPIEVVKFEKQPEEIQTPMEAVKPNTQPMEVQIDNRNAENPKDLSKEREEVKVIDKIPVSQPNHQFANQSESSSLFTPPIPVNIRKTWRPLEISHPPKTQQMKKTLVIPQNHDRSFVNLVNYSPRRHFRPNYQMGELHQRMDIIPNDHNWRGFGNLYGQGRFNSPDVRFQNGSIYQWNPNLYRGPDNGNFFRRSQFE